MFYTCFYVLIEALIICVSLGVPRSVLTHLAFCFYYEIEQNT